MRSYYSIHTLSLSLSLYTLNYKASSSLSGVVIVVVDECYIYFGIFNPVWWEVFSRGYIYIYMGEWNYGNTALKLEFTYWKITVFWNFWFFLKIKTENTKSQTGFGQDFDIHENGTFLTFDCFTFFLFKISMCTMYTSTLRITETDIS